MKPSCNKYQNYTGEIKLKVHEPWTSIYATMFWSIIVTIIINNLFFVSVIQYLKILKIVFRPKKLIKANYKPSKMKVLQDTFQQSFKLHNYCQEKKHRRTNAHILACTYKRTYA